MQQTTPLRINIKYFDSEDYKVPRLQKLSTGDWIDVCAVKDTFVPYIVNCPEEEVKSTLIPLGFAMQLPENYEAYMVPLSSTFNKWGILQTNHMAVINNSYRGDNDQWMYPVICLRPNGVLIKKGDKIGQFRIQKRMPKSEFIEYYHFDEKNRGGFETTG